MFSEVLHWAPSGFLWSSCRLSLASQGVVQGFSEDCSEPYQVLCGAITGLPKVWCEAEAGAARGFPTCPGSAQGTVSIAGNFPSMHWAP